jgi:hypothetical protein
VMFRPMTSSSLKGWGSFVEGPVLRSVSDAQSIQQAPAVDAKKSAKWNQRRTIRAVLETLLASTNLKDAARISDEIDKTADVLVDMMESSTVVSIAAAIAVLKKELIKTLDESMTENAKVVIESFRTPRKL